MATVDGGPVAAHVQAFADEINRRWGFTHLLTYPGHQPDQQHALDSFQTRDVMLQLAEWCTHDDVIDRFGIDYVIFNVDESTVGGEIYNREIARYWRHMEDRGSPTQNHHDHVHVSFNPTAKGPFGPPTPPAPVVPKEEDMSEPGAAVDFWMNDDGTGWVLDRWGGIDTIGNAPPAVGGPYWKGQDVARRLIVKDASVPRGYVLDCKGGVHPFGGAPAVKTPAPYWP